MRMLTGLVTMAVTSVGGSPGAEGWRKDCLKVHSERDLAIEDSILNN